LGDDATIRRCGANGATNILVSSCDLTGNGTAALYVPVAGTDVQVTGSRGYNDQGTAVQNVSPGSGTNFKGATAGYYGPVTFYTASSLHATITEIAINGTSTHLTSGSFTLAPGSNYATITWTPSGLPPTEWPYFLMIGQ
jgi:hypothetical protein